LLVCTHQKGMNLPLPAGRDDHGRRHDGTDYASSAKHDLLLIE
jgi:hypothetical protein